MGDLLEEERDASATLSAHDIERLERARRILLSSQSTRNVALVKSLGADQVVDYTQEDFRRSGATNDIVFDTVGRTTFRDVGPCLAPRGRGPVSPLAAATSKLKTQRADHLVARDCGLSQASACHRRGAGTAVR